jgi:hypothetical protein
MFKIIIGVASFVALIIIYIKYSNTAPTTISSTQLSSQPTKTTPPANAQTQNVDIPFKSLTMNLAGENKAMTAFWMSKNVGDPVVLFKNNAAPHQRVLYNNKLLKFMHSKNCVTARDSKIIQGNCNDDNMAKWTQLPTGQFMIDQLAQDGQKYCITADPTGKDESQLTLAPCQTADQNQTIPLANQKWRYEN